MPPEWTIPEVSFVAKQLNLSILSQEIHSHYPGMDPSAWPKWTSHISAVSCKTENEHEHV